MIRNNTIVTLRFTMTNDRGHVLEESQTTYLHGSSAISPRLQSQLEGLHAGDHRTIFLKKGEEDADDNFTFEVFIVDVRDTPPTPAHPQIHLLSGFLGSGKTTAIREACRYLSKQGIPVAVITNDQGAHLIDGHLFTHLGIPSGQVTNGCFCCKYNDLDAAIRHLLKHHAPGVVFAESVGSCTDLIATVLKPLLHQHPEWQTTMTTFADAQLLNSSAPGFDETVNYIYHKQLEEAELIVVSKSDLIDTTQLQTRLESSYPGKTILFQNSFDEAHIARWLRTLDGTPFTKDFPSLDIDYDTYGAGEAKLAWLDQQVNIFSPGKTAQHAAITLIRHLSRAPYPIGHLKFLLDGQTRISITATGAADHPEPQSAASATLLVNARIQTDPAVLSQLMDDAIRATERENRCSIRSLGADCFQPGYPRPTHRIS